MGLLPLPEGAFVPGLLPSSYTPKRGSSLAREERQVRGIGQRGGRNSPGCAAPGTGSLTDWATLWRKRYPSAPAEGSRPILGPTARLAALPADLRSEALLARPRPELMRGKTAGTAQARPWRDTLQEPRRGARGNTASTLQKGT